MRSMWCGVCEGGCTTMRRDGPLLGGGEPPARVGERERRGQPERVGEPRRAAEHVSDVVVALALGRLHDARLLEQVPASSWPDAARNNGRLWCGGVAPRPRPPCGV